MAKEKLPTPQTPGFKLPSDKSNELIRSLAHQTGTYQFLQIKTDQMFNTEASRIACRGFVCVEGGVHFECGGLVTDAELERLLGLNDQSKDWRPESTPPQLTRAMFEEMGFIAPLNAINPNPEDIISKGINHTVLNTNPANPAMKPWIIRMQERFFLKKSPSSVSARAVQILYRIWKAHWKTLAYWKNEIAQAKDVNEGSVLNLLLAFVLANSALWTQEDRARLMRRGPSAMRAMIIQRIEEVAAPRRVRPELEAAGPPPCGVQEVEDESEAELPGASEVHAMELSSDEDGVEGYAPKFILNFLKQLDAIGNTSHTSRALQLLKNESRTVVKMGLNEVTRLTKRLGERQEKEKKMAEKFEKAQEEREFDMGVVTSKLQNKTEEMNDLQSSLKQTTERVDALNKEKDELINELQVTTAQLRTASQQHKDNMQAAVTELGEAKNVEKHMKENLESLQRDLERAKTERTSAARELDKMRHKKEATDEEKRAMKLRITALETQLAETTLELTTVQRELQQSKEEVRLGTQAREQERVERESLRVELEKANRDAEYWRSQGEIVTQLTTTPEKRRALLTSGKKRKTEGGRRFISDEEIQRVAEEVEGKLEEGLGKQVKELEQYKSQVQQSVRELLSGATSQLDPKEISVEGYYQVMSLLVDMYRSVAGITAIALTDWQCEALLHEMPLEGKLVIPRMLIEGKLKAENPRVCHTLLGGLLNAHTAFMMNAQDWAMQSALSRPKQHELDGRALTETQLQAYEEQSAAMLQAMEGSRGTVQAFSFRLGNYEAEQKPQYGIRRMNWVFREAGWEAEGGVALGEMRIPQWAIDYALSPPMAYVAGLIPIDHPDSYEMRVLEKKIDVGAYLPYDDLMDEIDKVDGEVWKHLGPNDKFMRWLEDRLEQEPGSSIFGTNVPATICEERKRAQCKHEVPMLNRDVTSPSIFVGGVGDGPVLDALRDTDRQKLLVELRTFFMSCHRGNENEGALRDPRVLVAYAITKGLAMLLSIDWRVSGKFEQFELYKGVHGGGWSMYYCACSLGPRMVRWLSWAGRTGYLPGLHASLVRAVDWYTTWNMMGWEAREKRLEVKYIPTATVSGKHHEIPRHLPLPPREINTASNDEPWELLGEEREEWRKTKKASGWEKAVLQIMAMREDSYERKLRAALDLIEIDNRSMKTGEAVLGRCRRHPKDDNDDNDDKNPSAAELESWNSLY